MNDQTTSGHAPELPGLESDGRYRGLVLDGLSLKHLDLDNCEFDDCSLLGSDLTGSRFNATTFRACNLSNARIGGCNFFSSRFEQSKLLGVDFSDGVNLTATAFSDSTLDYATFRGVSLKGMCFERCSMIEADLSLTNLERASFVECDLSAVDVQEATFFQTDVRGSNLTGWNLRANNLAGTVMMSQQLSFLAHELGIEIIDPSGDSRRRL